MSIIVVSGSNEVSPNKVKEKLHNLLKKASTTSTQVVLEFPEIRDNPKHPKDVSDEVVKLTRNCINYNKDLYVSTYDDIVFNAIRIAISKESYTEGKLIGILNSGDEASAKILSTGGMSEWFEGIFDTGDNQIDEILFNN